MVRAQVDRYDFRFCCPNHNPRHPIIGAPRNDRFVRRGMKSTADGSEIARGSNFGELLRAELVELAFRDAESEQRIVGLALVRAFQHRERELRQQSSGFFVVAPLRKVLGPESLYFLAAQIVHRAIVDADRHRPRASPQQGPVTHGHASGISCAVF